MRASSTFTHRLRLAAPLLAGWFGCGLVLAGWGPHPRYMVSLTVGTSVGALVVGPYVAIVLQWLARRWVWAMHLRWPVCLAAVVTTVILLNAWLGWDGALLAVAAVATTAGTVLGHDAALAVLALRGGSDLDVPMVVALPLLLGLAAFGGYTSLGLGIGMLQFLQALTGGP